MLILGLLQVLLCIFVTVNADRKLADANFVQQQKQVLFLFVGLGNRHETLHHNEHADFDISANLDHFNKPEIIKQFLKAYKNGFLPVDEVFSLHCPYVRQQIKHLFDLFYFAKDFETFYKAASWARKHINQRIFSFTYITALTHRHDCNRFSIPPLYEILPTYFVPTDTMHQVYEAKMMDVKERKFSFNSTGYEYYYHKNKFGAPLSVDAVNHLDYKISYFREDIGLNNFYAMFLVKLSAWICPERYEGILFDKRGEYFYYIHQQLFARYLLERIANGMPYVERLLWDKPIKVGYDPRVGENTGKSLHKRPDNLVPTEFDKGHVFMAKQLEHRIIGAIDSKAVWNITSQTLISMEHEDGTEMLGKIIYGTTDRPNRNYFKSYFGQSLTALGYLVNTANDHDFVGEAISSPLTALRDPLYYQFLNRLITLFDRQKKQLKPYTEKEVAFNGVKIEDIEVSKMTTYFEMVEFDVTNGVPMKSHQDYKDYRYTASQYRLNHKPYTIKLKITSDSAKAGVVRIFIGPKYDGEEHLLTYEQSRMAFFELDEFPVKLNAGENVIERTSTESLNFASDPEGFKSLYSRVSNSIKNSEPFYINDRQSCDVPSRFQLPKGWKSGHPYVMFVIVTPVDPNMTGKIYHTMCGDISLSDNRPLGFPFDRPIPHDGDSHITNMKFKDVMIYHKDESDINRST